ncbi:MAG: class I SAM-dependent methyltransferase [Sphaerochaetaceae bacterium]|jgi:SAM-dependent methyltransferase
MHDSLPQQAYDELADAYNARIETKPHNAYYDRPAVQSLITDLSGKKILDAGCGPGIYTQWLLQNGASVTALDANERMLEHARKRNGAKAIFLHANLEEPLFFLSDALFDGIVSALTITYCKDLVFVFKEFSRVLKPNGWFVFSTEHPFFSYRYHDLGNYFPTQEVSCMWNGFGKPVMMKSYYHSLGTITDALTNNGFAIERVLEPLPTNDFAKVDSKGYNKLLAFPLFICIRAVKKT